MTEPVQSQSEPGPGPEADAARAEWMSVLARAEPAALAAALSARLPGALLSGPWPPYGAAAALLRAGAA